MEKVCKIHGLTEFTYKTRSRCRKCIVISVNKRRKLLKQKAVEYKGGKCSKCGYDKYIGALEFHHIDPTKKDFAISSAGNTKSWDRVREELDKCVLLCSNCHKETHNEINMAG